MIRRASPRPDADANRVAPANPTSATSAPPPGSLPPGGDQPPAGVVDELMAVFGVEVTRQAVPSSEPASEPATVAMAPTMPPGEVAARAESAESAAPLPATAPELVREPTRRSTRRSRKEAKRELKREKKRLAEHDKAQKKARQQTRRARRKARRHDEVKASAPIELESEVRIITSADPSVPPVIRSTADRPPDAPIQIGGGEELPDAVYLQGSLGEAGDDDRSTVFIDEDPAHAELVSIDVATSAARMEPRLRERRIAVKRAHGRRRLKWVAIVTAVVAVAVAAFAVLGSGLFEITTVRVDGRVYSGGEAFDAVVDDLEGTNVLRVDTEAAERALERIPWIEAARVTTDFPNGALVEVSEREPSIAYQGGDGRYRVLDREGRVLDVIAGQPVDYLELFVTGSPAVDLDAGQKAPPGYRAAATLAQALTPAMRARVTSISANADATDLRIVLDGAGGDGSAAGGIEVRFGAAQDLVDKLVRLQTALTDPDPEDVPTEMIDVSGPDLFTR